MMIFRWKMTTKDKRKLNIGFFPIPCSTIPSPSISEWGFCDYLITRFPSNTLRPINKFRCPNWSVLNNCHPPFSFSVGRKFSMHPNSGSLFQKSSSHQSTLNRTSPFCPSPPPSSSGRRISPTLKKTGAGLISRNPFFKIVWSPLENKIQKDH